MQRMHRRYLFSCPSGFPPLELREQLEEVNFFAAAERAALHCLVKFAGLLVMKCSTINLISARTARAFLQRRPHPLAYLKHSPVIFLDANLGLYACELLTSIIGITCAGGFIVRREARQCEMSALPRSVLLCCLLLLLQSVLKLWSRMTSRILRASCVTRLPKVPKWSRNCQSPSTAPS